MLKRLEVRNFKSFKKLELNLDKFNVVIGSNASGKSNFVEIFKFIRNIVIFGLENAISMEGGIEYLRNMKIDTSDNFYLKIVSDQEVKRADNLIQKCKFVKLVGQREKEEIGEGEIILSRGTDGKIKSDISSKEQIPVKEDDIYPQFLREEKLHYTDALIHILQPFFIPLGNNLTGISAYNFDPRAPKKLIPIAGKLELEEDGSNLPLCLKNIIKNEEKRKKILNLLSHCLPFIEKIDVEEREGKLLLKFKEEYFAQDLPAFLTSDGTINITAIIVALYFNDIRNIIEEPEQELPLTIIEEPERNIHPYLISKVVDMMKDASQHKQIIITTHNPEILKYADLNNILLISRDKDGFSTISKPADKERVKIFLKNDIGIDELYVQNLL
ncbi:MAG: ATPase [Candidatus Altiarchaeales archaeon HGW-Altiarchaeales-1]|nr:MAG: ATPase [Candidatus Altiarchaeales archaeon HGW-Altiarchaeales-1]